MNHRLDGLTAAMHTPFTADGELNLSVVEKQAEHLARSGVLSAFVCGTTGESHSLSLEERKALAQRWAEVARGAPLRVIVHVGSNCLADSRALAAHAGSLRVDAIAAVSPSYFKPRTVSDLVECCVHIASAAPEAPFYYYDIPSVTGVHLPVPEFLAQAGERVPTLAGVKYSNPDMMAYQNCLKMENGRFDVLWGIDEWLLGALALGGRGAVGSSYNFTAPIFRRLIDSFEAGDLDSAREEQFRAAQTVQLLDRFGYMAAARILMDFLGVPIGPPRLPFSNLDQSARTCLLGELDGLGFFDWIGNS